MNWLAHVFLSRPDIEFRLGNLPADLVRRRDRGAMSGAFQEGLRRHQVIDAFTDAHPAVHRSRARIGDEYRFAVGILVDVFYDHFLALEWGRYSDEPLDAFTSRLYAEIRAHPIRLPPEAEEAVERMIAEDRLGSYRGLGGIEASLRRVSIRLSERTGRDFGLERGVGELVTNYEGLRADFSEFFPDLRGRVAEEAREARNAGQGK